MVGPDLPAAHGLPIVCVMFRRPDFLIDEPETGAETVGEAARAAALLHDVAAVAPGRHWDGARWKHPSTSGADQPSVAVERADEAGLRASADAGLRAHAGAVARFGASEMPTFKVTRPTVHAG